MKSLIRPTSILAAAVAAVLSSYVTARALDDPPAPAAAAAPAQAAAETSARESAATPASAPSPAPPQRRGGDMGEALVTAIREVDGCLGVDSGRMRSGRNVIVAWFRDKQAVRGWYDHPTHVSFMTMVGGPPGHEPLVHVPENTPLMVIASITNSQKPEITGIPFPISQIAIELFVAAPGGAQINGRLSPAAFEVPHMRDYTPPPAETPAGE